MVFNTTKPTQSCGCATQESTTVACPNCHQHGSNVDAVTVKAQLKKEVRSHMRLSLDDFNFCANPKCDTVYYANDGSETFAQNDIKSKVTVKNDDPKTPLCYCRKLLKENVITMIENNESDIAEKVKTIIASGRSICEKTNPRGTCCTEDVKEFLAGYGIPWEKPQKSMFTLKPNPASDCCSSSCC